MTKDKTLDTAQADQTTEDQVEEVVVSEEETNQPTEVTQKETKEEVTADETLEEFVEEVEETKEEIQKSSEDSADNAFEESDSLIVMNKDVSPRAKWFVVHTYSGHEKKVAGLIQEFTLGRGIVGKIFRILIPTQKKIVVSDGKKRNVDERLFPGYIIINMIMDDEAWYLVRSTKGVTGFVGTGNTPTPLPQKEVDTLMRFMTMEAPKFEAKFRIGDSVKIIEGPFQDFLGKVDEVNDDQGKVRVLVSVFGRETPVELDFIQITSI